MKIFISYSHQDKALFDALVLRLRGIDDIFPDIDAWDDTRIAAGDDWHGEIQAALHAAQVVLLLVSPDFKASSYIRNHELAPALERESRGECIVVPVILRSTPFWDKSAFARLQALPTGGKHVKSWSDPDEAWTDVVTQLMTMAEKKGLLKEPETGIDGKNAVFHVPFPPNPYFAGRKAELDWLRQALHGADRRPAALLAGIGGVGKTTTAAQYAHIHRDDYDVVWWVEAETIEARDHAFANLAAQLRLPGYQSPKPEVVRAAVMRWLEANAGWLLVFDNAEAPGDLKGWLPRHPRGHALITSRNPAWGALAQKCPVEQWDVATAAGFLLNRTGSKDDAAARELAQKLGGLPLACEQAGAYVEANGISLTRYIKLFDESLEEMLEEGADADSHPSLTATVRLGLQSLAAENSLALEILRTLACFAPDDIPRFLLDKWRGAETPAVNKAVALLLKRALLLRGAEEDYLSAHRLVQALIRADDSNSAATLDRAVVLLNNNLSGHPQTDVHLWPTYAALLPHAAALLALLPDPPPAPAAGYVCSQFGLFLQHARGDYPAAGDWLARALRIAEAHLSADDPGLAAYLNNLGVVLRELGDLDGAVDCYERALRIGEAHYGPEHPTVATRISNLGTVFRRQGDLAGAKECCERALRIDEAHCGSDHPNVAIRVNNLGLLLQDLGDLAGAKAHVQRALRIDEAHYGPDHPEVAADLNSLGVLLFAEDSFAGAVTCFRRALTIFVKHLPPEHPHVQGTRRNLAEAEAALRGAGESPASLT